MLSVLRELPEQAGTVVVGGGLSGLMAARELAQAGHEPLILDARGQTGGRIRRSSLQFHGMPVEYGAAFMLDRARHPILWSLIDEFDLELHYGPAEPEEMVWIVNGSRSEQVPNIPVAEWSGLEASLSLVAQSAKRLASVDRADGGDWIRGLDVSYADFFGQLDLGPATQDLWRAYSMLNSGDDWDRPSVLPVLLGVAQAGGIVASRLLQSGARGVTGALFGPQLKGGTDGLVSGLTGSTPASFVPNCHVRQIDHAGDVVTLSTSLGSVQCRGAILAVPGGTYSDVRVNPVVPAFVSLGHTSFSGVCQKLVVRVSSMQRPVFGLGVPNLEPGFCNVRTVWMSGSDAVLAAFSSPGGGFRKGDVRAVQEALREYVPGVIVEEMDWHDWNSDPNFRGIWNTCRPGQFSHMRDLQNDYGRLQFAGSDIDSRIGLEGALFTGREAAARLMAHL